MCKPKIPSTIRAEVAAWMRMNRAQYMDFGTGEPEYTQIAEGAANVFERTDWLDDELHWIWEEALLAFEGLPE